MSLTDTEITAEELLATLMTNKDLFTGYYVQNSRLRSRCTRNRLVIVGAVRATFGLVRDCGSDAFLCPGFFPSTYM